MPDTLFSTILYVDREDFFEAAYKNIQENDLEKDRVQVIVIDPMGSEDVKALCDTSDHFEYIHLPEAELPQAYNHGLTLARGSYLNFALASAAYSEEVYHKARRLFETYDMNFFTGRPYLIDQYGNQVAYGGSTMPRDKEDYVQLLRKPTRIQLMLQGYFFKREVLEGRCFDESLWDEAPYKLLLEILLDQPDFYHIRYIFCYYNVGLEDNPSTTPLQYHKWWYADSARNFLLPLLQSAAQRNGGRPPLFLQTACLYLVYSKFNCNINDRNKGVLQGPEEVNEFVEAVAQVLNYIDNSILLQRRVTSYTNASRTIRTLLMQEKMRGRNQTMEIVDNNFRFLMVPRPTDGSFTCTDYNHDIAIMSSCSSESVRIRLMNYEKEGRILSIEANIPLVDYLTPDRFQVFAVSTDSNTGAETRCDAELLTVFPLIKCFGLTFRHKCPVRFRIPVGRKGQTIKFYYDLRQNEFPLKIAFDTANSRLTPKLKNGYWMFSRPWILTCKKDTLEVSKLRRKDQIFRERKLLKELYKKTADKEVAKTGVKLRIKYWMKYYSKRKKPIWITFDKLYKAGDNGEYMYQWCRTHQDEVEIFYVVRKDSPDYPRLVQQDREHVLVYGTLRCMLIFLLADVLLATHVNITAQYDVMAAYRPFTKDLLRGELVCIQHGLTIQKIAQYQNRQFDNTMLYCCASPYEVKNLSHPFYDYTPDMLKMTGLARYDGLVNNDQKIILITPSWRRNVVNSSVANIKKTHNDNFRNSDYFRIYNQLINDQRLIDCAKQYGYKIIYLLHPAMSAQLEDFDRNDYVELIPATGDVSYEKILTESSLMVTDYSGVQFDFAYMRKPIVYYHPDALPPHYDEGGLIYDTMGFGPICKNNEEVVDAICASMARACQTEEVYVKRADDFFAFDDHNNCERIFRAITDWQRERGRM